MGGLKRAHTRVHKLSFTDAEGKLLRFKKKTGTAPSVHKCKRATFLIGKHYHLANCVGGKLNTEKYPAVKGFKQFLKLNELTLFTGTRGSDDSKVVPFRKGSADAITAMKHPARGKVSNLIDGFKQTGVTSQDYCTVNNGAGGHAANPWVRFDIDLPKDGSPVDVSSWQVYVPGKAAKMSLHGAHVELKCDDKVLDTYVFKTWRQGKDSSRYTRDFPSTFQLRLDSR